MTDARPPDAPARATSIANTSALPPSAAARQRLPQRAFAQQDASPSPRRDPMLRRRSSLLSFSSMDDMNDILNPRTRNRRSGDEEAEVTHWHSSPLAFAILPAIGGLMFQDGSAFVTDVLLLGLAAIFMNWSIRLPWDWYYSAQAIRMDVEPDDVDHVEQEETVVETESSTGGSPTPSPNANANGKSDAKPSVLNLNKREEAAADLRRQELLALCATFLFPVGAAYLLHVIRAQLSRPSTGLVSDYNLCIFLLAAEIRPARQLIRLFANRTMYLQRTVTGIDDPFSSVLQEKSTIAGLTTKITDLEAKLSAQVSVTPTTAQKADVSDLSREFQKRYEPRFDGLERAVRRYEKRSITLAQVTEQRLQSLEARLQEALSLAAVAAQHSQNKGVMASTLETISAVVSWPTRLAMNMVLWPYRAIDNLYVRIKIILLGPMPPRSTKRKLARHDSSGREDRPRDKPAIRKIVR